MPTVCIQNDRLIDETPTEALSWTSWGWLDWAKDYCSEKYGDDYYFDGDPTIEFQEWKKRVRRRIEDAIRKDPQALMLCAKALNKGQCLRVSLE